MPKAVFLVGVSYLFVPIDLIPDRLPVVGHSTRSGSVWRACSRRICSPAPEQAREPLHPDRTRIRT